MLSPLWIAIVLISVSLVVMRGKRQPRLKHQVLVRPRHLHGRVGLQSLLAKVVSIVPDSFILPSQEHAFKECTASHWASQERVASLGIFRPTNPQELSTVMKVINEYFLQQKEDGEMARNAQNIFAVRGGGHSPILGAASIEAGIMIDLSLLRAVVIGKDRTTVQIEAGCRWGDVSKILDDEGLAVAGGRNSQVGVGGLTLGGGLSLFSPRVGLVCSNVIEYQIVLASGQITTASETSNPNLWRALKGGSNNFGIVTNFIFRCFPCGKIWSGFLYLPSFQTERVLKAFQDYVNRSKLPNINSDHKYDENSAGPIACFTHAPAIGMTVISVNIVHTLPSSQPQPHSPHSRLRFGSEPWPKCWNESSFKSLIRFWSTCCLRSLTDATNEMNKLNPSGRRQTFGVTTVRNDSATLKAAHEAYLSAIKEIKAARLNDVMFTLVLQPLLPEWVRKGDPNPLGFHSDPIKPELPKGGYTGLADNDPLVIASFTVNWPDPETDLHIKSITRTAVERIETFAIQNGTAHRYKYLNYCAEWQAPFEGYGEGEIEWLREVSKKYDPDGLFQKGCRGGFKLFDENMTGHNEFIDAIDLS